MKIKKIDIATIIILAMIPFAALDFYFGYYMLPDIRYLRECPGGNCRNGNMTNYLGLVGFKVAGLFQRVTVTGSVKQVFVLQISNSSLIRLLFYCRNGTLVTTQDTPRGPGIQQTVFGGYDFCNSVPFQDGMSLQVNGTYIAPSSWNPELSTPRLAFIGDLYVFGVSGE